MARNAFSSSRIREPRVGVLALHPFVDVLEGRDFLSASVHDGMVVFDAPAPAAVDVQAPEPPTTDLDGAAPRGTYRPIERGLLTFAEPARVELTTADGELTFGVTPIGDGDDTLFGNLLHDRRGREPLPEPSAAESAPEPAVEARKDGSPFRDGRALGGVMRPYLTMVAPEMAGAFAA